MNTRAPFEIGGMTVRPGREAKLEIPVARLVTQTMVSLPVIVAHGKVDGPKLWLSAAVHGDELDGIEIIDRVLEYTDARSLRGTVVAVPIVNVFGFLQQSRYLPDRRDLNRCFPGSPRGSLGGQLANLFLREVILRCTHGIDFHTGSNLRTNVPQTRVNFELDGAEELARAFGAPFMVNSKTRSGSLRDAADRRGIPNLLYEAGESQRFTRQSVEGGVAGALRVMQHLGMIDDGPAPEASLLIGASRWLRAGRAGIASLHVDPGDAVEKGQILGRIREPLGKRKVRIVAPESGHVLGLSTNPIVNRGDALVHLGASDN